MPERNVVADATYVNKEASSSIQQWRVAVIDESNEGGMTLPSGASSVEKIAGVTTEIVAAGETGKLTFLGIEYCEANAAIALGDTVVIASSVGRIMSKPAGATTQGIAIVGVALRAADAQGDEIPVFLQIRNEYVS